MTPQFADLFGAAKADLFIDDEVSGHRALRQTGGAYLDDGDGGPDFAWPTEIMANEPLIETFVVDDAGACVATGSDAALIDGWNSAATTMARLIRNAAARRSLTLAGPGYLTATVTPSDQVATLAHFDDDHYLPADGVGFVAIVGSLGGPRVASAPVVKDEPAPGTPVELTEAEIERFDAGEFAVQSGAADRVVAFPQFGQLHAGPRIDVGQADVMRYLMVFRSATAPR